MTIYTRTGDDGTTGLVGGRARKDDPRVAALGDVDELSAVLGLAASETEDPELLALLRDIQRDLVTLGTEIADIGERAGRSRPDGADKAARIARLEQAIDDCEASLPTLRTFVLPGGCPLAAALHVARAVCRRAERAIVALSEDPCGPRTGAIDTGVVAYVNRLSDLLFVLARRENQRASCAEDLA